MKANGSCLCNAIKYSFELKGKHFDACHCSMCRKWGGGPAFTVESAGDIKFVGEENFQCLALANGPREGFAKSVEQIFSIV